MAQVTSPINSPLPLNTTPALAKANKGKITKFTARCRLSSSDCSGLITRSEADSTRFSMAICLLVSTISSSFVTGNILIVRRMRSMYFPTSRRGRAGITKASNTPAMVLCMPDCKKRYQITIPISMKKVLLVDTLLPMRNNISNKTAAQAKYPRLTCLL